MPDKRSFLRGRNLQTRVGTFQRTPRRTNFRLLKKKHDCTCFSSPLCANSLTSSAELQTIKNNAAAQARARVSLSIPFNYFAAKAAIISQLKRDYNDSQIYLLFKSRVLLYQFNENISLKILPALKRYYLVFL